MLFHDIIQVLDKSITPAVYRLVCKHLGESRSTKNVATDAKAVDEWIDCWVGCANVLIQNNYKVKAFYCCPQHNSLGFARIGGYT